MTPHKPRRIPERLRQARLKQLSELERILEQLVRLNVPQTKLTPIKRYAQRLGRSV